MVDDPSDPKVNIEVNDSGSLRIGGDLVAGDKFIIQYIVMVGRALEYARIEELLPAALDASEFPNIQAALEGVFTGSDPQLVKATATAGVILKEVFEMFPVIDDADLPYKDIVRESAPIIYRQLKKMKYWEGFATSRVIGDWLFVPKETDANVFWLNTISKLWKKHLNLDAQIGLAELTIPAYSMREKVTPVPFTETYYEDHTIICFVERVAPYTVSEIYDPFGEQLRDNLYPFSHQWFRLFMVGLILDIIQMVSESSKNKAFWQRLIDSLDPN